MTDVDEAVLARAMSRALHSVADDPAVGLSAPGLADRVERAHRRRRALLVTGSAAVVVAVVAATTLVGRGAPGDRPLPPTGPTSTPRPVTTDLKAAVRDARFVKTIVFDGGALTIEPADGPPHVTERDALNLFRTTGGAGATGIRDVVVGYGMATLQPDLTPQTVSAIRRTPVWVVVFTTMPHPCPMMTAPATAPEGRHVFLLDRNGSWAVDYVGRGSFCGQPVTGPTAETARTYASAPWTAVHRNGARLTVRFSPGGCTALSASMVDGTPGAQELAVVVRGIFSPISCPAPLDQTTVVALGSAIAPVTHAPTGPIRSYTTDGHGGLQVYDGR